MLIRLRVLFLSGLLVLGVSSLAGAQGIEVLSDRSSGRMFAIRVTAPARDGAAVSSPPAPETLRQAAADFLMAHRELLGVEDLSRDFDRLGPETDQLGLSRVVYLQRHHGLEVMTGEIRVHLNRSGDVTYVKAKAVRDLPNDIEPRIPAADAAKAALRTAAAEPGGDGASVTSSRLLILPVGVLRHQRADDARLAWDVEVANGELFATGYFIDALTGELLIELSRIQRFDAVHREVLDCAGGTGATCQLDVESPLYPGYFHGRSEGQPARGPYPNPVPGGGLYYGSTDIDSLYVMVGAIHDLTSTFFGINGANGYGGSAIYPAAPSWLTRCVGHADTGAGGGFPCFSDAGAAGFTHPFGTFYFCRYTPVWDTVGHEYTHSIVFHSFHDGSGNPVGATYYGESGALNEAFADLYGEFVQYSMTGAVNWKNGDMPQFAPIRDMANPHSILEPPGPPYPDHFYDTGVVCSGIDLGGVHGNSTIVSHAFYLFAVGGTQNGCTIVGQGIEPMIRVFFRGWRTYFSSNPTFNEAYADLIQACTDLYPASVVAELTKAMQAVEMDQPGLCSGIPEIPPPCSVVGVNDALQAGVTWVRLLSANPTRGGVNFAYRTARDGQVEARIRDIAGRLLARPVRAQQLAGEHNGVWDGRLESGGRATPGVYFLSVSLDGSPLGGKKLLLVR